MAATHGSGLFVGRSAAAPQTGDPKEGPTPRPFQPFARLRSRRHLVRRKSNATRLCGLTLVPDMFSSGMRVILEINREFPYQVVLSFDEIAMEVLAWLD